MKTIFLTMTIFLFSLNSQAQNKNVKETTKTTVTTVSNSDQDKTFVKKENVREVQNVELKEPKANTINVEMKESPVQVTSVTKITNPDGTTRTVDVDRSSYYELGGSKYKLVSDPAGYKVIYGTGNTAVLRKTSINSYVYKSKSKTAVGYFDVNGNLVLETYDPKSDKVISETYIIVKK
ncbi:MAG: hypothetical protein ABI426_01415 [Flavobacterium sp.]